MTATTSNNSSKVFFDDLEEIELSLSSTSPLSSTIRIYIQTTDSFILHDQLTLENSPQPTYLPYSSSISNTKLKFETISSSTTQQTSNEFIITLSSLLESPKQSLAFKLSSDNELLVSWIPAERSPLDIYMTIENLGLRYSSSWFKKFDMKPYLKIARCVTDTEDAFIYTSEAVRAKGFFSWAQFKVGANQLCKGDKWTPIKIIVCYKVNGNENVLGEGMFSLEQILNNQNTVTLADKSRQKRVGSLRVMCEIANNDTFSDYVRAGLKFNTMLAVDFSDSQCQDAGQLSNHFVKNDKSLVNDYQKVMMEIYPFLSQANISNKLAVYGLGGLKSQEGKGSCFDVRRDNASETPVSRSRRSRDEVTGPWISSLNELLIAYEDMVINNKLGGECKIANVIEKAKCLAKFNALYRSQEYVVLVIVTDGYVDDYEQTLRTLQTANDLPISVIFVEVGNSKTENLSKLERSLEMLDNRPCVSFTKLDKRGKQGNRVVVDIIKEIPKHIREFIEKERETHMTNKNIEYSNVDCDTEDSTPKSWSGSQNREAVLRRTLPPMMKTWIYENNKKEFLKAREMVEKMSFEFRRGGKAFV